MIVGLTCSVVFRALVMSHGLRTCTGELPEPREPGRHPRTRAGAHREDLCRWIYLSDVVYVGFDVRIEVGDQIDLVQQDDVDGPEHHRVFERLVLTLGDRVDHCLGVLTDKDGAYQEHLDALNSVIAAARSADADPMAVTCAVDWLLYDWLMAHRDGPDSAEIVFRKGR